MIYFSSLLSCNDRGVVQALNIENERGRAFVFIFGCFVYFLFCFSLASGIKPITGFMKSVRNIFSWSNPAASFLIFVVSQVVFNDENEEDDDDDDDNCDDNNDDDDDKQKENDNDDDANCVQDDFKQ